MTVCHDRLKVSKKMSQAHAKLKNLLPCGAILEMLQLVNTSVASCGPGQLGVLRE